MENGNIEQSIPISNPPVNQPPQTTPLPVNQSSFKKPLIIGGVILGLLLFGAGGYVLGMRQVGQQNFISNVPAPPPSPISDLQPSPTSTTVTAESGESLPSGWTYTPSQQQPNANDCVSTALPPMKEPYTHPNDGEIRQLPVTQDEGSGRFWYIGGGTYPNLLSKLITTDEQYRQNMAVYATETEASGYISQAVAVSCIPNTGQLTNQSLLTSLNNKLQEYNNDTGEKGMQANQYTISSSKEINRWGIPVVDLVVSELFLNPGGSEYTDTVQYTVFATPEYIYEVRVFGGSDDLFVQQTAQQIFNNLKFQ